MRPQIGTLIPFGKDMPLEELVAGLTTSDWVDTADLWGITGGVIDDYFLGGLFTEKLPTMAAIVASEEWMAAIVASEVAMAAIVASEVAMAAIVASEEWMAAIVASEVAMAAIVASEVAMAALAISPLATTVTKNVGNTKVTMVDGKCWVISINLGYAVVWQLTNRIDGVADVWNSASSKGLQIVSGFFNSPQLYRTSGTTKYDHTMTYIPCEVV